MPDFIIVGQGIAGISVARKLEQRGYSFIIYSDPEYIKASSVSAGIINPITGRRFVLSWNFPTLFESAGQFYYELKHDFGLDFFREKAIFRAIHSVKQMNDWSIRTDSEAYSQLIKEKEILTKLKTCFSPVEAYISVHSAMQVDLEKLGLFLEQKWQNEGKLVLEKFIYSELNHHNEGVNYRGIDAGAIIFSDGANVVHNPFFNYLPIIPNQGELLIARIPDLKLDNPIKQDLFFVPLGDDEYWIGSSYTNIDPNDPLNLRKREQIISRLDEVLKVPYEELDYRIALRPTVKDRRPIIGNHPEMKNMYIINGLGTKGASLAPYCASNLLSFILDKMAINADIDINRFGV